MVSKNEEKVINNITNDIIFLPYCVDWYDIRIERPVAVFFCA